MNNRQTAIEIFLAAVDSVKPDILIKSLVSIKKNRIHFNELIFDLKALNNIYVVGAGKASSAMAQSIESILGSRITAGHIITKYNHSVPLKFTEITEAGHPVPDENGVKGTRHMLSILNKTEKNDLVICLISGGGSALLADVPEQCTLEDLKKVNTVLLEAGANITEINCIRKHLSKVKGGLLAKAASPAKVITLILSDIIGDPLDAIASGPTVADPTTFADAIEIINKYNIKEKMPQQIYQILLDGVDKKRQETLKESDKVFVRTYNLVIGNNILALKTAKKKAESLGYSSRIITNQLDGDISDVADYIVKTAKSAKDEKEVEKICLLFGGEPTVKINGNGLGGRNQHLALVIAKLLKDDTSITFLSGGTDGSDGPTDAAGATVDSDTLQNAYSNKLDIEQFINNYNSYNFFKEEGGLIKTGPTQTNVMDIMIVLIN